MDDAGIDAIARALAAGQSRRRALRLVGGFAAGGLASIATFSGVSANHRTRHCAKDGKRCHKHKECCGLCGSDGVCRSCHGVVAWADRNATRLTEAERYANNAKTAIQAIPLGHPVNRELLGPVTNASTAISAFSTELSTEVTPPPADDIVRTLIEIFAAMADALAGYLEEIADDAYLETGAGIAVSAIDAFIAGITSTEASIAALRNACDD